MKKESIGELAVQTLTCLQEAGLSQASIHFYREEAFKPVLQFFERNETTSYCAQIMDEYIRFIICRLNRGEIGEKHFRALKLGAERLSAFAVSGQISIQPKKRGPTILISDTYEKLLSHYIQSLEQSESTLSGKAAIIRRYFAFLWENGKFEITEAKAADLKRFVYESMKCYGSKSHLLSVLRDFHKFTHNQSLIGFDYENALCAPAAPHKKVMPCFSQDELNRITSAIDVESAEGKRDYAIILLAANTGLRTIDIAHLKLSDIDWKNSEISIVQQKTNQTLVLPLEHEQLCALDDYIWNGRPHSHQGYVFLRSRAPYQRFNDGHAIGSMFRRRLKKAGLPKENGDGRSVHGLRRTLGTRMAEADVPLTTISQVLGHRSSNSAKQYLSLDCTHLKKCALSLSGIAVSREELM
jgi:integrase